jgi:hypothetical protein
MDISSDLPPVCRVSSLYLDYGADAETCGDDAVDVSERGMRLRSHWHFEIGTQLSVSFVCHDRRRGPVRLTAEGIVVWCEPCEDKEGTKAWESTLLFLELPDELIHSLRELSFRISASREKASASP